MSNVQAMDELELSSLQHGGVKLTGFRLIDRDRTTNYLRHVLPSVRRPSHRMTTRTVFTVCIVAHAVMIGIGNMTVIC